MKILVIKSHPRDESYCHALTDEYVKGALQAGSEVEVVKLNSFSLEQHLKEGHQVKPDLSPELLSLQKSISTAECLVFAYPTWWTTPPALLKLFIESLFISGFAFRYHKKEGLLVKWDKLLQGKAARLLVTMDSPPLFYKLLIGDPGYKMMKGSLGFCGIKPVRRSYFGSVKMSSPQKKKEWLNKAYRIGEKERRL